MNNDNNRLMLPVILTLTDGRVLTALMPLSGTREGGALVAVDIANFSEFNDPASNVPRRVA